MPSLRITGEGLIGGDEQYEAHGSLRGPSRGVYLYFLLWYSFPSFYLDVKYIDHCNVYKYVYTQMIPSIYVRWILDDIFIFISYDLSYLLVDTRLSNSVRPFTYLFAIIHMYLQ